MVVTAGLGGNIDRVFIKQPLCCYEAALRFSYPLVSLLERNQVTAAAHHPVRLLGYRTGKSVP